MGSQDGGLKTHREEEMKNRVEEARKKETKLRMEIPNETKLSAV